MSMGRQCAMQHSPAKLYTNASNVPCQVGTKPCVTTQLYQWLGLHMAQSSRDPLLQRPPPCCASALAYLHTGSSASCTVYVC